MSPNVDGPLKVNKESVSGLAQKDVEAKLRGEPGSKVRLKVSRGDDSFHCTIARTDLHSFVVKKTKEAPVKEPEPKKKKLTDREKADKLLNQVNPADAFLPCNTSSLHRELESTQAPPSAAPSRKSATGRRQGYEGRHRKSMSEYRQRQTDCTRRR